MKTKLIHIMGSSPSSAAYVEFKNAGSTVPRNFVEIPHFPGWAGFFEGDFYVRVAKRLVKDTDQYEIECWRPYVGLDKIYSKKIDGVVHRIFPSVSGKKIKIYKELMVNTEYSEKLIENLRKEISSKKVILHLHGFPGGFNDYILKNIDLSTIPVVVQHRGGRFKFENYNYKKETLLNKFLRKSQKFFDHFKYREIMKDIDVVFTLARNKINSFRKVFDGDIFFFRDGRDFDFFNIGNQEVARKKLALPNKKIIALCVAGFNNTRGVDTLLEVYKSIKDEIPIEFLFVGGSPKDKLYVNVKESGALYSLRVSSKEILDYYHACDFTISAEPDKITLSGGLGGVPLEAAACGKPSISRSLLSFKGTKKERDKIGMIQTKNTVSVIKDTIKDFVKQKDLYVDCRRTALEYYDENVTIKYNIKTYDKLFYKYYT